LAGVSIEVTVLNIHDLAGNQAEQVLWSFVGASIPSDQGIMGMFRLQFMSLKNPLLLVV
jgi:hypothetical protein